MQRIRRAWFFENEPAHTHVFLEATMRSSLLSSVAAPRRHRGMSTPHTNGADPIAAATGEELHVTTETYLGRRYITLGKDSDDPVEMRPHEALTLANALITAAQSLTTRAH